MVDDEDSRELHFCPGAFLRKINSIFVPNVLILEVDSSMEAKRGSSEKVYSEPDGSRNCTDTWVIVSIVNWLK